jgi:hypothetical protein
MAKTHSTEEILAKLGKLMNTSLTDSDVQELQHALNSANNVIVAKAAKAAATCGLTTLLPHLTDAFMRSMKNAA